MIELEIKSLKYGDRVKHKKTGRIAYVAITPSGKSGCVRLGYENPVGKNSIGRHFWIYVEDLQVKFETWNEEK